MAGKVSLKEQGKKQIKIELASIYYRILDDINQAQ